nr:MAG TPA: hypothetical protein [Caudoviricetes sp.]
MKIRSLYITASRAVSTISKKWEVNPVWVWDLFEEEFNIIKGLGNLVSQDEIDRVESIISQELNR